MMPADSRSKTRNPARSCSPCRPPAILRKMKIISIQPRNPRRPSSALPAAMQSADGLSTVPAKIPGAYVAVDRWRGAEALEWRSETDAEGRFSWDGWPGDRVLIGIGKDGYKSLDEVSVGPSDNEVVFTLVLRRLQGFKGTVVDSETNRPYRPSASCRASWRASRSGTSRSPRRFMTDATKSLRSWVTTNTGSGIAARGYRPRPPIFARHFGEQVFNSRLERGRWLEGTVLGLPANRWRCRGDPRERSGDPYSAGKHYEREYHPHQVTGADGRFAFSPPAEDFRIIALHDLGYGEATGDELDMRKGSRSDPGANRRGAVRRKRETQGPCADRGPPGGGAVAPCGWASRMRAVVLTHEKGHFAIERVTPGEARVHWQADSVEQSRPPDRYDLAPYVAVEPGKTAHVELVLEEALRSSVESRSRRTAVRRWGMSNGMPSLHQGSPSRLFPPDCPGKTGLLAKPLEPLGGGQGISQAAAKLRPYTQAGARPLVPCRRKHPARGPGSGSTRLPRQSPPGSKDDDGELARLTRDFTIPGRPPARRSAGPASGRCPWTGSRCSAPAIPPLASRSRPWMGSP